MARNLSLRLRNQCGRGTRGFSLFGYFASFNIFLISLTSGSFVLRPKAMTRGKDRSGRVMKREDEPVSKPRGRVMVLLEGRWTTGEE